MDSLVSMDAKLARKWTNGWTTDAAVQKMDYGMDDGCCGTANGLRDGRRMLRYSKWTNGWTTDAAVQKMD